MFKEVMDGEVGESVGGVYLFVVKPSDPLGRRVNVCLTCDPCRSSE